LVGRCRVQTSGQRISTKGRIAGADFSRRVKFIVTLAMRIELSFFAANTAAEIANAFECAGQPQNCRFPWEIWTYI